jgi:hypothetical protein
MNVTPPSMALQRLDIDVDEPNLEHLHHGLIDLQELRELGLTFK